jgi:prepilin-type N-terminal cleavage/methylation domain-containing protein
MSDARKSSSDISFACKFAANASKILKLIKCFFVKETREENSYIYMKNLRRKFKNQQGFNLIELMIVIAIIALLIGVGVPAWQSMVRNGNETTAAQSLQTIKTLQAQYASKHQGKFAANFDELIKSASLDEKFAGTNPVVNGYIFTMKVEEQTGTKPAFYSVNADPQVSEGIQATGNRHFYFDSTLATTKATEENRPAKADDPSI